MTRTCCVCRYFNKELSEEEKRLIGDIAPKKIQEAVSGRPAYF